MRLTRSRLLPFGVLMLVPLAVACERQPEQETMAGEIHDTAPPAELRSAIDRYIADWNGDDPAAVGAHFTDDATAIVGDETFQGRETIVASWVQPTMPTIANLETVESSTEPHGDDYRTSGTYSGTTSAGEAFSGRHSITWTPAAGGQWRIRHSDVQPDVPIQGT